MKLLLFLRCCAALYVYNAALAIAFPSVSIHLSNVWSVTNERNFCPHFYIIWKSDHPSFPTRRMVDWWQTTPCTWNCGPNWPHSFENADFQSIFARSTSAVTSSEKSSIISSWTSTTCFKMILKMNSVHCPWAAERAEKCKVAIFGVKVHFSGRKSATKFVSVELSARML